jgi:hypothetical protein
MRQCAGIDEAKMGRLGHEKAAKILFLYTVFGSLQEVSRLSTSGKKPFPFKLPFFLHWGQRNRV